MDALVEEAMKKAAIAWLNIPGRPIAAAVWCLWSDGALYVVSGEGEQPAPGLTDATEVTVTARGDHGGRILSWPAAVHRVVPGSDEWQAIGPQLAAKRLNAPLPAEQLVARWAQECTVIRLAPTDAPVAAGAELPDSSLAAPAPPTEAARRTRPPFRLHRVRRR